MCEKSSRNRYSVIAVLFACLLSSAMFAQYPNGAAFEILTSNITDRTLFDALVDIVKDTTPNTKNPKKVKVPWIDLVGALYESAWNNLMKNLIDKELCSAANKWDGSTKEYIIVTYYVYPKFFSGDYRTVEVIYALGVEGGKTVAYPIQEWEDDDGNTGWDYFEDDKLEKVTWGDHPVYGPSGGDSDPWGINSHR